ncbi:MAG: glutathione S-transferase N-terminal domain-containing protein [Candidatus Kaiserbacteria bacterium]|nr:glutathione S-transferase N-terminal domain-containing protein [Candidatus Kaiserbacteria bacterium]MCB9812735.1 glutathione S-transferase N-terminal domain-containing protein [Candidatus Nomurabacteria bacterium]
MLTLYMRSTCPFCQRVIQMAENLNVALELKDVDEDTAALAELEVKTSGSQVPYLVDSEKEVAMFESSDIIEYLRENYANTGATMAVAKSRVHVGGSVCESCEG